MNKMLKFYSVRGSHKKKETNVFFMKYDDLVRVERVVSSKYDKSDIISSSAHNIRVWGSPEEIATSIEQQTRGTTNENK